MNRSAENRRRFDMLIYDLTAQAKTEGLGIVLHNIDGNREWNAGDMDWHTWERFVAWVEWRRKEMASKP